VDISLKAAKDLKLFVGIVKKNCTSVFDNQSGKHPMIILFNRPFYGGKKLGGIAVSSGINEAGIGGIRKESHDRL
jgi:hypothetical protein